MDNIFKDYDFIHVYVDDMLISSNDKEQHFEHLNIFVDLCITHGIGLSKKKSIIGESKIEFLGLIIDAKGIELQTHILEKIKDFLEKNKRSKTITKIFRNTKLCIRFYKKSCRSKKTFKKIDK